MNLQYPNIIKAIFKIKCCTSNQIIKSDINLRLRNFLVFVFDPIDPDSILIPIDDNADNNSQKHEDSNTNQENRPKWK